VERVADAELHDAARGAVADDAGPPAAVWSVGNVDVQETGVEELSGEETLCLWRGIAG
jgi:hypothetical protein